MSRIRCALVPSSLFLTSKVRLHCDLLRIKQLRDVPTPFPDLKGQAPLRPEVTDALLAYYSPFPDLKGQAPLRPRLPRRPQGGPVSLFLTSKVRLHCDIKTAQGMGMSADPFPDLKGQAPLRPGPAVRRAQHQGPFPDLKGQAPLRRSPFRRKFGQAMCFS